MSIRKAWVGGGEQRHYSLPSIFIFLQRGVQWGQGRIMTKCGVVQTGSEVYWVCLFDSSAEEYAIIRSSTYTNNVPSVQHGATFTFIVT